MLCCHQAEQQPPLVSGPSPPGALPPLQQLQTQQGTHPVDAVAPAHQLLGYMPHTVTQQQQQQQHSGSGQAGHQDLLSATPFAGASLQVCSSCVKCNCSFLCCVDKTFAHCAASHYGDLV